MKILKTGKMPDEHVYRLTCHRCETEFECDGKEAAFTFADEGPLKVKINCPLCKAGLTRVAWMARAGNRRDIPDPSQPKIVEE
jgi:hypothetical protein